MEMEQLLKLINTVSSSKLTDFEYEENGVKIDMKKGAAVVVTEQGNQPQTAVKTEISVAEDVQIHEGRLIKSPLVGTFYAAPSEDASSFVSVGDTVKKGQTMAIVEAMKLMNEIESEFDGVVKEVFVQNGQAVEYGEPLFRIE